MANGNDVTFVQNQQTDDQEYHYRYALEQPFVIQYNQFALFFK
jgi:hypothetical protein